jgi:hypothetical protein
MYRPIAVGLLLLFVVCAPVRAQVIGAQPDGYQSLLQQASRAFSRGDYRESLGMFRAANRQWPNARALRAIGGCEAALGDYAAANVSLQDALHTRVRPLDAAERSETERLLMSVRDHLARYTVITVPSDAEVRVDGVPLTPNESGAMVLALGVHSIEASAKGYMPMQREVVAEAGSDERVELSLIPLLPPTSVQTSFAGDRDDHSPRPRRKKKKWWLWASVAGAVVAGGVATAVMVTHDGPGPARPNGGSSGIAISVPPSVTP